MPDSANRIKARVGRYWPRPRADQDAFRYIRGLAVSHRSAAVRTVADQLFPRARHGQRAVAYALITLLVTAPSGTGFHRELGRAYLAGQAGACRRTVTTTLMALRAAQLVHTPRRGRHGEGVAIMAAAAELVHRVADVARSAGGDRSRTGWAKVQHRNRSHGANHGTKDTPHKFSSGGDGPTAASPAPDKASPAVQAAAMEAIRARWKARTTP